MNLQNKNKKNKFFNFIKNEDKTADLYLYGRITSWAWNDADVSADGFRKELEALENIDVLNIHINSYGGEVFEGFAIYNLLKQHSATKNVYIDGIAASIASVIAMAGDYIYMSKTSIMMIHNCLTYEYGNANQLRKTAEDMDKIMVALKAAYSEKIKITEEELQKLLDDEEYMTADECKEKGFADEIIDYAKDDEQLVACMSPYNLVMKLKSKEKELEALKNENKVDIDYNNIADNILNNINIKLEGKIDKVIANKANELIEERNKKNEDTLAVSFLNSFLKK